jgi:hypothetical protein
MKEKLASRKLWVAVMGVVTGVCVIVSGNMTEGVATVIASVLGYIMAEGYIDAKAVKSAMEIVKEVDEQMDLTETESEDE